MSNRCPVCGAALESGAVRARNQNTLGDLNEPFMVVTEFAFVRPGVPTSANPVSAFLQGLREEPSDQALPLTAYRCTRCGRVEFYAAE
jgi:ribosomal protein S14